MKNSLTIFELKRWRCTLASFISIISILTVLIIYIFTVTLVFPGNNFMIISTFFIVLICIPYICKLLFSEFVYHDTSQISCNEKAIVISKDGDIIEELNPQQIDNLEFDYKGDIEWRAINPRFQKRKSRRRYRLSRFSFGISSDFYDKITINSQDYLVKIRDSADKDYYYKIIDWANSNGVKYELHESKFYAEFK